MPGATPPNADLDRLKRFILADTGELIQIEFTDTGKTAADGSKIFALGTSVSSSASSDLGVASHTLVGVAEEQIGTGTYPSGFTLLADPNNVATMKFGPTGSPTFPLEPGESVPVTLSDLSKLFGIGTAGDTAYVLGGV